jgi:RimJ/RimL family protein N-acetyltransferase
MDEVIDPDAPTMPICSVRSGTRRNPSLVIWHLRLVTKTPEWRVAPITRRSADEITRWEYPPPFERYSLVGASASDSPALPAASVRSSMPLAAGSAIGASDPTAESPALDTGGGLRPDLTGLGLGRSTIRIGLDYGWATFDTNRLRITVWTDNERALRAVRSLGCEDGDRFVAPTGAPAAGPAPRSPTAGPQSSASGSSDQA